MGKEEIKEFVNKVMGKKIRWHCWPNNEYCVPDGRYNLEKEIFWGVSENFYGGPRNTYWDIRCGLALNYWSFVEDTSPTKEFSNTCNHEWIDVGFMHHKFVCKHCNVERKGE